MPTYEYECSACGERFELFQQITEGPKRKCIHCGRLKARRFISAGSAVIFRGSGFYQTDYRSEEYKSKAKAEKENAGKASDSGDPKSSDDKASSGGKKSSSSTDS